MFKTILKIFSSHNPRVISSWNMVLDNMKPRIDLRKERFQRAELLLTNGVELLRYILLNVNVNYFLKQSSDIKLYFNYVEPTVTTLQSIYDSSHTGRAMVDMYVKGKKNIPELIVSSSREKVSMLPLGDGWEKWEKLNPLKLIYFNSLELNVDMEKSFLSFEKDSPTFALSALDTSVLIFKYLKYPEALRKAETLQDFIQKQVLDSIINDSFNIWVLNVINYIIDNLDTFIPKVIRKKQSDKLVITSTLDSGLEALYKEILKVKHYQITVSDFLASKLMYDRSIFDIMETQISETEILDLRQNMYLKFLSEVMITKITLKLCNLRPNDDVCKRVIKELKRKIDKYQRMNIVSHSKDTDITKILKDQLLEISKLTNQS